LRGGDAIAVGKLLVSRAGAVSSPLDRCRITTCGRLFEGTDEISLGQTRIGPAQPGRGGSHRSQLYPCSGRCQV